MKLEEMSLEQLWQLFPIFLVEHSDDWAHWYEEEARSILEALPSEAVRRISHIGSTTIPGIHAKNIVDILLELESKQWLETAKQLLMQRGWRCMSSGSTRISLNKGYTERGFADRVFHLHIRIAGDNDELYFRDYLNEHHQLAEQYEKLKLSLWRQYEHDRDGYTEAKSDFVKKYTALAKEKYKSRY